MRIREALDESHRAPVAGRGRPSLKCDAGHVRSAFCAEMHAFSRAGQALSERRRVVRDARPRRPIAARADNFDSSKLYLSLAPSVCLASPPLAPFVRLESCILSSPSTMSALAKRDFICTQRKPFSMCLREHVQPSSRTLSLYQWQRLLMAPNLNWTGKEGFFSEEEKFQLLNFF
ncbi:hypothetical protein EVAR_65968_1 [Eumeta japonica]|uniref:Uncharacterized protein n=1 Tax=Eumeta variegata TaxID=151549 RepID=A0A4C1Z9D9_EUMVA|nr:hypothetical protein EVAR_65968_1 [Eumeta japonica]